MALVFFPFRIIKSQVSKLVNPCLSPTFFFLTMHLRDFYLNLLSSALKNTISPLEEKWLQIVIAKNNSSKVKLKHLYLKM